MTGLSHLLHRCKGPQEVEVHLLGSRETYINAKREVNRLRAFAQSGLNEGWLDEAATRSGNPIGEFVSCRRMRPL
jgi:hypothetical protein